MVDKIDINNRTIRAIEYILDSRPDLSKSALADELGVKPSKFSEILNKRMMAGTEIMSQLVYSYNISSDWLLTGDGEMLKSSSEVKPAHTFALSTDRKLDIQDIPLYDLSATAGLMAIFTDNHINPEDYLRVPNLPPVDGAIYVRGESMTPLLKSGDIIIYKRLELTLDSILWGQIYLLSFDAGGDTFTVVKYVQKSDRPDHIRLVSQNERFQPKDIPLESIHALAIVKASITFHTIE